MKAPKVLISLSCLEHLHARVRPSWELYAGGSGALCYFLGHLPTSKSWLATWSASIKTRRAFIFPNVLSLPLESQTLLWPEISYMNSLHFTFCLGFAFGLSKLQYFSPGKTEKGISSLPNSIFSPMFYPTKQLPVFLLCLLKLRFPRKLHLKLLLSNSLLCLSVGFLS